MPYATWIMKNWDKGVEVLRLAKIAAELKKKNEKQSVEEIERAIADSVPVAPMDWREHDYTPEIDYEECVDLLKDMIHVLTQKEPELDLNLGLANVISDLCSEWEFSIALWVNRTGGASCNVYCALHPKGRRGMAKASGFSIWDATLRALLEYIDTEFDELYDALADRRNKGQEDE